MTALDRSECDVEQQPTVSAVRRFGNRFDAVDLDGAG